MSPYNCVMTVDFSIQNVVIVLYKVCVHNNITLPYIEVVSLKTCEN